MDSVGRQPAANQKLLYFTVGAGLKMQQPICTSVCPSPPCFDKGGTGCAELQLDKYQPILSLPRGAGTEMPSAPSKG